MNLNTILFSLLQEKEWKDLVAIMHEYFVSSANSWQAELLDWVTDEVKDAAWQVRDKMIDKIIAEVDVESLIENGYISEDSLSFIVSVEWDTDNEAADDLPSEVEVPYNTDEDSIADYLSDEYGYCVKSFVVK